jgi:hypothetical protein
MSLFILIPAILLYFLVSGVVYKLRFNAIKGKSSDPEFDSFLTSIVWPLSVPFAVGSISASYNRSERAESKRERQLIEARHQIELAKLENERTRELEKALDK